MSQPSRAIAAPPIDTDDIILTRVDNRPTVRSHRIVHLHCPRGRVETHYYGARSSVRGVLYMGGLGETQTSPAAKLFPTLAEDLQFRHVLGLRLKFRRPEEPGECAYDARLAIRFLHSEGCKNVALVGFGPGAPAAVAGAIEEEGVSALALLSTPVIDADLASLAPRCRLLMIHGGRDHYTSIPEAKRVYDRASDPKELLVLPRTTYTLNENSTDVQLRLRAWLLNWMRG